LQIAGFAAEIALGTEKTSRKACLVISQKAKYAFKALVVLAKRGRGESVQTDEIAEVGAIPRKFLEQILLQLKASGLVESRRGRAGGYLLAADPAAISVSQVLRIIDGPIAPLACISRTAYARCRDCRDETLCAVRRLFAETYASTLEKLEQTTLAQALAEPSGEGPAGAPPRLPSAIEVLSERPLQESVSTVRPS
jgi:Rrf2 family protein